MKRTQLYLEDDLWTALHLQARAEKITLSELVRRGLREKYLGDFEERRKSMQALIGIRRESADAGETLRALRRGARIERLAQS